MADTTTTPIGTGRGPDFICIGSSRCGTTFLHRHLRTHPGLWLTPIKELHYFDAQQGAPRLNRRSKKHLRKIPGLMKRSLAGEGPAGLGRDICWALRYYLGRRSDDWYLSLFPPRPGRLSGEITPAYCVLKPEQVEGIHRLLPHTKIIFMMRDPIERSWSSVVKQTARAVGRSIDEVPPVEIERRVARPGLVRRSDYAAVIRTWERFYEPQQVFYGFLEEIRNEPAAFLDRLCEFLGVGPHPQREQIAQAQPVNTTAAHGGSIPDAVARRLAEAFLPGTAELAARFGGYPEQWHRRCRSILDGEA